MDAQAVGGGRHDGRVTITVPSAATGIATTGTATATGARTRRVRLPFDPRIGAVFAGLQRGAHDPAHRRLGDGWLRATRTPEGPALLRVARTGDGVQAGAWGDGAEWALDRLPALFGADDDPTMFRPQHPLLVEAVRRHPDVRIGRTGQVFEALSASIIEQKVTGLEAYSAIRRLLTRYGEPAPGPAQQPGSAAYGMRVPPDPHTWATIPSWQYLRAGVESSRSRTLVGAARRGRAIERLADRTSADADRGLCSLPGVGPWTSAEVRQRSHGDPDAWSIGDYHVGKDITWALTGEVLDDDACEELLEPYRGHRYRVQVLLGLMGSRRPRRAPRMALPTHTPASRPRRS